MLTQVALRVNPASVSRASLSVVVPAVFETEALYRALGGMPVVARTLMALDKIPQVTEIVVVVRAAELRRMADICRILDVQRVRKIVCVKVADSGKLTKGDGWVSYSTGHGQGADLQALTAGVYECEWEADYIAIHDPQRPFVTEREFRLALAAAEKTGVGVSAVPVKDTIKIVQAGVVQETPDRSALHTLQTPQIVESSLLKSALVKAAETEPLSADLPAMLERLGLPLHLAEGSDENIRIVTEMDILAAQAILNGRVQA